jgi:predicted phosphoribosyltransferase
LRLAGAGAFAICTGSLGLDFAGKTIAMLEPLPFHDRIEAGRTLAMGLVEHKGPSTLVLGIPCGGVVVAREVAKTLELPLDVWAAAKGFSPRWPSRMLAAVAEGDEIAWNREALAELGTTEKDLAPLAEGWGQDLARRAERLREGRPAPSVRDKTVIVVDDGIETGATASAVLEAVRRAGAKRIVLAVPVGSADVVEALQGRADAIVCLTRTDAVKDTGAWYEEFPEIYDADVASLLRPRSA